MSSLWNDDIDYYDRLDLAPDLDDEWPGELPDIDQDWNDYWFSQTFSPTDHCRVWFITLDESQELPTAA